MLSHPVILLPGCAGEKRGVCPLGNQNTHVHSSINHSNHSSGGTAQVSIDRWGTHTGASLSHEQDKALTHTTMLKDLEYTLWNYLLSERSRHRGPPSVWLHWICVARDWGRGGVTAHGNGATAVCMCFFFFLAVLWVELRASYLWSRCCATWAMPPVLFCFFFR